VPVGGADVETLSIASRGNRLLYTQGGIYPNIWEIPLGPDRQAQTSRPLLASTTGQGNPQFSPDGSRIAFYSRRSGSPEIWVCNSDGSNPVQLTSLGVLTETPRWSPDGKMIAFDSRPAGHSQVLILPSGGGEPRPLTGPENESTLSSWSRDGRWIYFTSNRGGLWQIWKIPSAGGKAIQVTENGGFVAFESADGKDLVYAKDNESGFWMRSIGGGPESRILNVRVFLGHWALGRSGIYFVDQTGAQAVVKYYDFAEHKISSITRLARPLPPEEGALAVSPDERRILVMEVVTNMDIMLVENFH
jgi:Tol biopolymer transport system component